MSAGKVVSRLRLSLAVCVLLVAAGILTAGAGAINTPNTGMPPGAAYPATDYDPDADPSTTNVFEYPAFPANMTNVPYLAWRGEQIRFVKCDDHIPESGVVIPNWTPDGFSSGNRANLWIEDFSAEHGVPWPEAVTGSFYFFHSNRYKDEDVNCIGGAFSSNKAGIAQIKLEVFNDKGEKVLAHTYLAAWLGINTATVTNAGSVTEPAGADPGNAAIVEVTGSIPVNLEFQTDWGLPSSLQLPRDWSLWAHAMATIGGDLADWHNRGAGWIEAWRYWDIHDSSAPASLGVTDTPDQHVDILENVAPPANQITDCDSPPPDGDPTITVDTVDNCLGGTANTYNDTGTSAWNGDLFSRVFGDTGGSGVGPFDHSYPQTILSDGNLNAADAPLPQLQINFNVSCVPSCTMGYFVGSGDGNDGGSAKTAALANKAVIYSRDPSKPLSDPHNLYAPYYGSYVPATSRGASDEGNGYNDAGGTFGTNPGPQPNNFGGYQEFGLYTYWGIEDQIRSVGVDTKCRLRDVPANGQPAHTVYRQTNDGQTTVAVYTDEHGEARVAYEPGVNSDAFANAFVDMNGCCDLEGVTLGPQTISATAVYPFQKVALPFAVSGTITKNITNLFRKRVVCIKKDNTSGAIAYICTADARDIDGSGVIFNGEKVCFGREPDNVWYDVGGSDPHPNGYCVYLSGGTATAPASVSVETDATRIGEKIDVVARFTDEHLIRDTCITVGQSPSVAGPCSGIVATGTVGPGTGPGTGPNTQPGQNGITSLRPGSSKAKAASVSLVRLVVTPRGRVLKVRIASASKTAKIQVRLINARGKVITIAVRTVKTNKLVLVPNLRVGANVKSVRVKVLS